MRARWLSLLVLWSLFACTKTSSSEAERSASPTRQPEQSVGEAESTESTAPRVDAAGLERLVPVTLTGTLEQAWSSASTWGGERRLLRLDGPTPVRVVLDLAELEGLPEIGATAIVRGSFGAARPRVEDQLRDASVGAGGGEAIAVVGALRDPELVEAGGEALDARGLELALLEHPVRVRGRLARGEPGLVLELGEGRRLVVRVVAEVAKEFDARVGEELELEGALRLDPEIAQDGVFAGLFVAQPKLLREQ